MKITPPPELESLVDPKTLPDLEVPEGVAKIFDVITPRQRMIVYLMLSSSLDHLEIARVLGCSTQTVRNHMVEVWDRIVQPRNVDLRHQLFKWMEIRHEDE